jgi:hypothetical protein
MFEYKTIVSSKNLTDRANHLPEEGGALNAGYTSVDALCMISNLLGRHGLTYNKDWWWDGFTSYGVPPNYAGRGCLYNIRLEFKNPEHICLLKLIESGEKVEKSLI